jgi:hypothetical protein
MNDWIPCNTLQVTNSEYIKTSQPPPFGGTVGNNGKRGEERVTG